MSERSIPDLYQLRRIIVELVDEIAPPEPVVVDLGCSLGAQLEAIATVRPLARLVGVDSSPAMLTEARQRGWPDVEWIDGDVRAPMLRQQTADVILLVFTLQFIPVSERAEVLRRTRELLRPGGLLVLAEKVTPAGAFSDPLVRAHHARKVRNGYSPAQVAAKRASLEGVLTPLAALQNESMLHQAGFDTSECVWRSLNFAAWAAS